MTPVHTRVFDAHVDSLQRALDLGHDLIGDGQGHLDLERGMAGGLASLVFVSWVDPKYQELAPGARGRTRQLLAEFHKLIERRPDRVRFAGNGEMMRAAHAAGAVAGIPGIEGGHSIEERIEHLEEFFEHGIRVMTLVWNNHLSWIRSCRDGAGAGIPEGLSSFGRDVVRTMNELGMLVDLSHAGERAFYDTLDVSSRPVIASHSGCKALHEHARNLTDDQLRAMSGAGGVAGIVFCTAFLSRAAQEEDARLRQSEGYRAIVGRNDTETILLQGEYLQQQAVPLELDCVVDHIAHAASVAGVDHVGLGTDFDGIERRPRELEDAACYSRLAARMRERGFAADEVEKVMGANMERVFAQVTGAGTQARSADLEPLTC